MALAPNERIRRLTPADAVAYWHLRLEAVTDAPFAFGVTPEEHRAITVEQIADRLRAMQPDSFILGLFVQDALVGVATLDREPQRKERHKAHIHAVYVTPTSRGGGRAHRLLSAVIEQARADTSLEQLLLAVRAGQNNAGRLYRGLGFTTFGTEPNALKIESEYIDEEHMILRLR